MWHCRFGAASEARGRRWRNVRGSGAGTSAARCGEVVVGVLADSAGEPVRQELRSLVKNDCGRQCSSGEQQRP